MKRLLWLDIAKALAISWVVYFHFFNTCFEHAQFPPDDWSGLAASAVTIHDKSEIAPTLAMLVGSMMMPEPIMFTATMNVSCIRFICHA